MQLTNPRQTHPVRSCLCSCAPRARIVAQLDRFPEAILDFGAAESLSFPRPAQRHLARGIAWEQLRILDRAARDCVEALSAAPADRAKIRAFFHKR